MVLPEHLYEFEQEAEDLVLDDDVERGGRLVSQQQPG